MSSGESFDRFDFFKVLVLSFFGTAFMAAVTFNVLNGEEQGLGAPFVPYEKAPTAAVIGEDFPEWEFTDSEKDQHDGTQFYVMAKNVFDMGGEGANLDRPEYRWQRPMFAWLASPGYFFGGPTGLVVAFFVLNILVLFVGSVFTGLVSLQLRGPPAAALIFALLPGALYSMALAVADALALMFFVAGLFFWLRRKYVFAGVLFAFGGLSKETILITVFGFLLGVVVVELRKHRSVLTAFKANVFSLAVPAFLPFFVVVSWWAFVKYGISFNVSSPQQIDVVLPFSNFTKTFTLWAEDPYSFTYSIGTWVLTACVAAYLLIRYRFRHPFCAPVYLSIGYLVFVSANVLALSAGSTRALYPALLLGLMAILTSAATYETISSSEETNELSAVPTSP